MDRYLKMVFRTDRDRKVTIKVVAPREDIIGEEVRDVMNLIIANDSVYSTAGNLLAIDGAFIVETGTTELDLVI